MTMHARRSFLLLSARAAGIAVLWQLTRRAGWAFPETLAVPPGRSAEKIRGFPFEELDSFLTPTEKFFLRSHLEIPTIDPGKYRLQIGGSVQRPYSLTLADLERMSSTSMPATFECSGSAVGGGMISTAQWNGASLLEIVERAKPRSTAVELVMEGADAGLDELVPVPVQYARSVPLATLRGGPGLVVLAMNGKDLRPEHGYPARVVLPGLYGVQNVKWISRLTLVDRPFQGFYQTQRYVGMRQMEQGVRLEEILRQRVKSQIARVTPQAGRGAYRVTGAAWSGGSRIVKVEVSLDGGKTWLPATLTPAPNEYSWVLWSCDFTAKPGPHELIARATDLGGQTQPLERNPAILTGYVNNWCDRKAFTVPA